MKKIIKEIPIAILLLALSFLLSMQLFNNPFSRLFPRLDNSIFMYFGKAMAGGKTLYSEIFDHKGPLIFVLNYFGTFLPGKYSGIYWIELVCLIISIYFLYKTSRLFIGRYLSLIPPFLYSVMIPPYLSGGNLTEAYALPLLCYTLYLFAAYFKEVRELKAYEALFVGISVALAFLLRANLVLSWLPMILGIFIDYLVQKKWPELRRTILFFSLGLFGALGITALILNYYDIWDEFIYQAFEFNLRYIEESAEVSIIPQILEYMLETQVFYAYLVYVLVVFIKVTHQERLFNISLIATYALTLYSSGMSGRLYDHYLMPIVPVIILIICEMLGRVVTKEPKWWATLLLVVAFIFYVQPFELRARELVMNVVPEINTFFKGKTLQLSQKDLDMIAVSQEVKQVTEPTDEIYSLFDAGAIYVLSDRLANTKYFSLPAVDINGDDEFRNLFFEDFKKDLPEAFVFKRGTFKQPYAPLAIDFKEIIDGNYYLYYRNQNYELYIPYEYKN